MSPSDPKHRKTHFGLYLLFIALAFTFFGWQARSTEDLKANVLGLFLAREEIMEDLKELIDVEPKFEEPDSIRGIYITAFTASTDYFNELIDTLLASGGNAVVLDVEISGGKLAFIPENEYLASINPGTTTLQNLPTLIDELHEKGIYVIARQVIFNDPYTAGVKPEWRIKNKWGGLFDYRWIDPSHPEVQDYNLLITREVAKLGFDEVQYDYIRFPAENHYNLDYYYDEEQMNRWDVITDFLRRAKVVAEEEDVKLSVDVFGATVWGDIDWRSVGQHIVDIATTVDAIYPMTYPSHVSPGYYGFQNPYGDPASFIKGSIEKFIFATGTNDTEIRTWVQGFPLKVPTWGSWFMNEQVRGTYEAGANDFIIWSPGNRYGYSWPSLGMEPPEPTLAERE